MITPESRKGRILYNSRMVRVALCCCAALLFLSCWTRADTPTLENDGKPMRVPVACSQSELESLGMSCSEDEPCPLYVEFSAIEPAGTGLFIAGNIHGSAATVSSIFLGSFDGGKTWIEPYERIPSGALDQIQFLDADNGWVSGSLIQTLPRDPFFLITSDGGKTWRRRPVFEDMHSGSVDRFWFESPNVGTLFLAPSGGASEAYQTIDGGESWQMKQAGAKLPTAKTPPANGWRLHANAKTASYDVERKQGAGWERVASFLVEAAVCK